MSSKPTTEYVLADGETRSSLDEGVVVNGTYILVGWVGDKKLWARFFVQPSRGNGTKIETKLDTPRGHVNKLTNGTAWVSWLKNMPANARRGKIEEYYRKVFPDELPAKGEEGVDPALTPASPARGQAIPPAKNDLKPSSQVVALPQGASVPDAQIPPIPSKKKAKAPSSQKRERPQELNTEEGSDHKKRKTGTKTPKQVSAADANIELFDPNIEPTHARYQQLGKIIFAESLQLVEPPPTPILRELRTFHIANGGKVSLNLCYKFQAWLLSTNQHRSQTQAAKKKKWDKLHPLMARVLSFRPENRDYFEEKDFGVFAPMDLMERVEGATRSEEEWNNINGRLESLKLFLN